MSKIRIKSLSENTCGTQCGDGELKMQEAQIIGRFLFPADQQPPCAVGPGVGSLDNPSACFSFASLRSRRGFTRSRNMRDVSPAFRDLPHGVGIVSFVGTEMLLVARRGLRATNGDTLKRLGHQLLVMHIRA